MLLLYLGLPEFGIRLDPLTAVLIALAVNNGAYLGEIIRGGLQGVPKGQLEAASAIGLPQRTTFSEILLPQALRSIYPALVNQFILTILASSIASIIGAAELTQQVLFIDSRSFRTIELLAFLTAAYALLTFTLARVARLINARMDRAYAR
jgi:polar amino acid transport system permease protein